MMPVDMSLKNPVYIPMISISPISFELKEVTPGERTRVGGQSAIGGRDAYHHAPIAIEIVAEANIVPLGIESLVQIDSGGGFGAADIVLRLISAPKFEENSAAVVLLLRQVEAADVEHAATAGTSARCRRRQAPPGARAIERAPR